MKETEWLGRKVCSLHATDLLSQPKKKVLCIGDIVLDVVLCGERTTSGLLHIIREYGAVWDCKMISEYPGGAAGLACYLQELGNEVTLIAPIGCAHKSEEPKHSFTYKMSQDLAALLQNAGVDCKHLMFVEGRPTPIKFYTYEISEAEGPRWADRIDIEGTAARSIVDGDVSEELLEKVSHCLDSHSFDAVVIEDNGKGLLSALTPDRKSVPSSFVKALIEKLEQSNHPPPIFLDARSEWEVFRSLKIRAVLPNSRFAYLAASSGSQTLVLPWDHHSFMRELSRAATRLFERFRFVDEFLIKCGRHGVLALFRYANAPYTGVMEVIPAWPVDALSTVGCGDVFDAYYISLVIRNGDPLLAALWSNFAASLRAEHGMGFFPVPQELHEKWREVEWRGWPPSERRTVESKAYKILNQHLSGIKLDDGVIAREGTEGDVVMSPDGVILMKICEVIKELGQAASKLLVYGPSDSGKSKVCRAAAYAVSRSSVESLPYSGDMADKLERCLTVSDICVIENFEPGVILQLAESGWIYSGRSSDKKVDLSKHKIIFDTSDVDYVRARMCDFVVRRNIPIIYFPHPGEEVDGALEDIPFLVGRLLSKNDFDIEARVLAALLWYEYGPGRGRGLIKWTLEEATKRAKGRKVISKDDIPNLEIHGDDTSVIPVVRRSKGYDNLLELCRRNKVSSQ